METGSLDESLDVETRRFLLDMMPSCSVCAEIGVWKGEFSAQILESVRPSALYLIDPWEFQQAESYKNAWYGGTVARDQQDVDRIYQSVVERFARPIAEENVKICRCPSQVAVESFDDYYFDWVYIDGNPFYECVTQDLERFSQKVKRGGYITGDDYGTQGWWKGGVTKAVDEFTKSGGCEVVALKNSQFIIKLI